MLLILNALPLCTSFDWLRCRSALPAELVFLRCATTPIIIEAQKGYVWTAGLVASPEIYVEHWTSTQLLAC